MVNICQRGRPVRRAGRLMVPQPPRPLPEEVASAFPPAEGSAPAALRAAALDTAGAEGATRSRDGRLGTPTPSPPAPTPPANRALPFICGLLPRAQAALAGTALLARRQPHRRRMWLRGDVRPRCFPRPRPRRGPGDSEER